MSEERRSPHPQDGTTKWMSGAPLWDSYVADLAARTTGTSSSLSAGPDHPTCSSASPAVPGRYFLPPWNFNPAAAAAAANLGANCAGASVGPGPNLWNVANSFSGPNRSLPSIGLSVPPAFPGSGPSFFQAQDKMLNEFLTRPPPIHESAPRPSSASVLGEKFAAEALTALNFNLNMNGVRCGDQIPTTSTQETMPLDKAHLLRGILQGCNRAMPDGMDLMTEPLVRDFSGKVDNNNMVLKTAARPDVLGRLLGASRRSRRESAAPPVRDRRSIKRPRQDSIVLRTMQEKYEMEKAMIPQPPFLAKELPPPPPLRPASAHLAYKMENGDMHHSDKGSDNEMEDKHQSDMDENSNGPVHVGNGHNGEEMGNPDEEELPESVVGLAESVVDSVDDEEMNGTTEEEMTNADDGSQPPASPAGSTGSAVDVKKARVENIVSVMRASPILGQGAVNGCKKRKLYQPRQQHSGDEDAGAPAKLTRTDDDAHQVNGEETTDDSQDEGDQPEMSRPASTNGQESQPRPAYSVATPDSNHRRYSPEPAPLREKSSVLSPSELADLGETLKAEMYASLASIVDSIVSRYTGMPMNNSRSSRLLAQLGRSSNRLEGDNGRQSPRSVTNKVLDGRSSTRYNTPAPGVPMGPTSGNASENVNVLNLARMQSNLFQNKQFSGYQLAATASNNVINLASQPASWHSPQSPADVPEQKEALSLVVTPKKKRQKVTDSKAGARPFGKYIGSGSDQEYSPKTEFTADSPSPRESNSIPTTMATPISLQHAGIHPDILSSYSAAAAAAFYGNLSGRASHLGHNDMDSTPTMLHPAALLSAAHQAASPADLFGYGDSHHNDSPVTELSYDGYRPVSSTLTPMHLRKAKLMFFWVRYPSSAILKTFFPDINFNKNNTAQLVKWFSNFREFYYIQMEKYARQALAEGIENPEDIRINPENCELLRILNLHYNRNNHIDMPASFSYVVEQTMREFFKAVKEGKDCEPTWKKTIYKIIARLDDSVPEYFKTQSFLEQLE